ncbi:MAG: FAD-dependent monooxygenase, partial [Ktedonobacteraceae bacterium]|nr:FAD-dependent monooxygenase [Ktedonobacteraceae bacterium]
NGTALLSNNSKWISFAALSTRSWHHQHIVLLGDAAHTAHFSIGSGTKLAMEDDIALASALEQHPDLETALNEYELERKPVVEIFQRAARESQAYFETLKRYLGLAPMPFTFQLLTRSGRITYDDLRLRDPRFIDSVDRRFATSASRQWGAEHPQGAPLHITIAPPPMFAPLTLRDLTLPNRVIVEHRDARAPLVGLSALPPAIALSGAGLVMTGPVAVSADGRITPDDAGIYTSEHVAAWAEIVQSIHSCSPAKVGVQLSHAGRRGSTQPRTQGLDRPLREGNWPLISASPLPYTPESQVPKEMDRADMDRVQAAFVQATHMALEAGFDLLQLHFAHGYLLASFLSPLTNLRADEYGGNLEQRMRFPLEIFDAVRSAWPQERPISVALSVIDYMKGGLTIEDAIQVARALKEHGCDIIAILAGQTTMQSEAAYGRGFLTPLSDRVRNEAAIPTLVGGYLTTSNEVNTILAAGRADLCILEIP